MKYYSLGKHQALPGFQHIRISVKNPKKCTFITADLG